MNVCIKCTLKDWAEPPFFLTNKEWYYYDDKEGRYKLTDKAPEEAKKSYEKHYTTEHTEDGAVILR